MKKLYLFLSTVLSLSSLPSFGQNTKPVGNKESITDFIVYDVKVVNDAVISFDSTDKNNLKNFEKTRVNDYLKENEKKYFNSAQTKAFVSEIKNLLKNKNILFFDGCNLISNNKAYELTNAYDEIKLINSNGDDSLDIKGNAIYSKITNEFERLKNITKIQFYEEWKKDKSNQIVEKNLLGYMIYARFNLKNSIEVEAGLFGVVKDKATLEKIKYYSACDEN